jgi:hypothetical protein
MNETRETSLIPLADAVACLWPASDGRLHLRIVRTPPTPEQRAWLAARRGYTTILDATGSGDVEGFYRSVCRDPGWAGDGEALVREWCKLDCAFGAQQRVLAKQCGWL